MDFVFDPSLVLYLPLYDSDGASFMSKDKHGHLCTVTGATWRPQGREFNGTSDLITLPIAVNQDGAIALTCEMWVKVGTWTGWRVFISSTSNSSAGQGWGIIRPNSDLIDFQVRGKSATYSWAGDTDWHHIVGTWSLAESIFQLYLDGSPVGSNDGLPSAALTASGLNLYLGRWGYSASGYYSGIISEVRIYNRALTPQEIQHNYLATKWRYR